MRPYIINGDSASDDRGVVQYVNTIDCSIKRMYKISNHVVGFVRAWHGHERESKYMICNTGAFRVATVNLKTNEISVFYLHANKPAILFVPPGHANGIQNMSLHNDLTVLSTSTLDESLNDDIRFTWDHWGKDVWNMEDYR